MAQKQEQQQQKKYAKTKGMSSLLDTLSG